MMDKVAVIIPAYNQAHFLGAAIQSVLAQTYQNFQVIIVDDGSTDNTKEVANGFKDHRIEYIYQANRGLSAARNTGIRTARCDYLTFLDADDLFLPTKLALLVGYLENHREVGLVAGQSIPVNEHGKEIGKIFNAPFPTDPRQLLLRNPVHVGSVVLSNSWREKVGYFDENLRSYEDWDFWLRLARMGCSMGWVAEPVAYYRFHSAQMTRIGKQMTQATFMVLDKFFADRELPALWVEYKDQAYSFANLRAAAQAFHARDYLLAQSYIDTAVELNPSLVANSGETLVKEILSWKDLPKEKKPLEYLEQVYDHLPNSLEMVKLRKNLDLSRAGIQMAFDAYQHQDFKTTRSAILFSLRLQPAWLFNRGVLSIFLRSLFHAQL